jgi:transketolase
VIEATDIATKSRITALRMVHKARAAHIGSSLSVIDILVASFMHQSINKGSSVILSKGHAAAGLYAVLNAFGQVPDSWIDEYCEDGARLGGHATNSEIPGVIFSTGSLGHGLPFAVGVSYRKQLRKQPGSTIVVMSDGECDEGSNWEGALLASHLKLSNLVAIIDRNRLQSFTDTEATVRLEPLAEKWASFGWDVAEVNGHDIAIILDGLDSRTAEVPKLIIANTLKGKGVSFMENNNAWHYKSPNDEELEQALRELRAN